MTQNSNKPTLTLCLITKTYQEAEHLAHAAIPYFDKIIIQTNAAKYGKAKTLPKQIQVYFKPWTKDFGEARNDVLKKVDTDYWFWCDTDDEVNFSKVPLLAEVMQRENLDAMYLEYDYAQDNHGKTIATHWRERLIRTAHPFEWKGAIHETLISASGAPRIARNDELVIHHKSTEADMYASLERNHEILVAEIDKENPDPRMVHYAALSFFGKKEYLHAIELFKQHIRASGWDEESYRSYNKIAEAYFMMDDTEKAISYSLQATTAMPQYPDAYINLANFYMSEGDHEKANEWARVALSKERPETLSIVNPTMYTEQLPLVAAISYYELGNFEKALQYLDIVERHHPDNEQLKALMPVVSHEYKKKYAIEEIKKIIHLVSDKASFFHSLAADLKRDLRLRWLRNEVVPPKEWGDKDIVFFCGESYEEWGPHTLDKGMGGSEEAIVYLSRALTELGYRVTVYNSVESPVMDWMGKHFVNYVPWREFDTRDQFSTVVLWRAPEPAPKIKAKLLLADIHDVIAPSRLNDSVDKYLVKTRYHRNLFPHLPDEKFAVIGNGIVLDQFNKEVEKKPYSVGYFSAYYRGLETLLAMWPAIRAKVPEATLDVFYGWESWVSAQGKDDFYMRMEAKFKELADQGVTVHGRVSHQQLADEMAHIKVWAYPTEFPEIHCITALKAQQAGCIPVTTDVAALQETVQSGMKMPCQAIYTDIPAQKEYIEAVVEALKSDTKGKPMPNVSWNDVAKQWKEIIDAGI